LIHVLGSGVDVRFDQPDVTNIELPSSLSDLSRHWCRESGWTASRSDDYAYVVSPRGLAFIPADFTDYRASWTQYGHALQIPRDAHQRPLTADLLQTAQRELAKAHHRFDDAEDRLDRLLA
jgi:hypothetical protein